MAGKKSPTSGTSSKRKQRSYIVVVAKVAGEDTSTLVHYAILTKGVDYMGASNSARRVARALGMDNVTIQDIYVKPDDSTVKGAHKRIKSTLIEYSNNTFQVPLSELE
jgi:hypothetical protein